MTTGLSITFARLPKTNIGETNEITLIENIDLTETSSNMPFVTVKPVNKKFNGDMVYAVAVITPTQSGTDNLRLAHTTIHVKPGDIDLINTMDVDFTQVIQETVFVRETLSNGVRICDVMVFGK